LILQFHTIELIFINAVRRRYIVIAVVLQPKWVIVIFLYNPYTQKPVTSIAQPNVTQMVSIVINITKSSCINIYITFCCSKKFKTVVFIMKTALVISIGGSTGCSYPFL